MKWNSKPRTADALQGSSPYRSRHRNVTDDRSQKPLIGRRFFLKDMCAQLWSLTYCRDWKRSEALKKGEIERPLNGILSCCCFLLGEFVSYINYTKKDWVLEEKHETNGLQLFVDHRDNDFWRDSLTLLTMNRSFRVQVLDMQILLHPWAAPPVVALVSGLDLSTLEGFVSFKIQKCSVNFALRASTFFRYLVVYFFVVVLSVTWTKLPFGQTLNHVTFDAYRPSPDRDLESHNLYCFHYVTNKRNPAVI